MFDDVVLYCIKNKIWKNKYTTVIRTEKLMFTKHNMQLLDANY